jgi:hypothetical protein
MIPAVRSKNRLLRKAGHAGPYQCGIEVTLGCDLGNMTKSRAIVSELS